MVGIMPSLKVFSIASRQSEYIIVTLQHAQKRSKKSLNISKFFITANDVIQLIIIGHLLMTKCCQKSRNFVSIKVLTHQAGIEAPQCSNFAR